MPDMAWRSLRAAGTMLVKQRLNLTVVGEEHLPKTGPVIIAARHVHHLYDGAVLMATMPRPMHILVGLDWVGNPVGKAAMEKLCSAAGWPVVLRRHGTAPVNDAEASRKLRHAYRDSLSLLKEGRILLMFPEGYPNIDPGHTPKPDDSAFLPFQPGFAQLAVASARLGTPVPIVPTGFFYERGPKWHVTLRFGEPVTVSGKTDIESITNHIEATVKTLSGQPTKTTMR